MVKSIRQWSLIIATGAIGFAVGIALFAVLGVDGILRILNALPAVAVAFIFSFMLALGALAISALIAVAREHRNNWAAGIAVDNMTQGLSMFDSAARLVFYNTRYIEMSKLSRQDFWKGVPLREILSRRAKAGTFSGDPDQYIADCLKKAAGGRSEAKTVELKDGRTIGLVFCPVAGGGWVSTLPMLPSSVWRRGSAICCGNARNAVAPSTRQSPHSAPALRTCS